jgi:hypothetical protein
MGRCVECADCVRVRRKVCRGGVYQRLVWECAQSGAVLSTRDRLAEGCCFFRQRLPWAAQVSGGQGRPALPSQGQQRPPLASS